MKNQFFTILRILIVIVLAGKVANWFLDFSNETNQYLNMAMFGLIGIAYLVMGYVWEPFFLKVVIMACGVFLIAMNFFDKSIAIELVGIACILVPMLLTKFYKGNKGSISPGEQ